MLPRPDSTPQQLPAQQFVDCEKLKKLAAEAKVDCVVTSEHEFYLSFCSLDIFPIIKSSEMRGVRIKAPFQVNYLDLYHQIALFKFYEYADFYAQNVKLVHAQDVKEVFRSSVLNQLGYCFQKGIGTPVSEKNAVEKYKEAAALGSYAAMNNLITLRLVNALKIKNIPEIKQAAEDFKNLYKLVGFTPPMSMVAVNYAEILLTGIANILPADKEAAYKICVEGAKKNDCLIQNLLGYFYASGEEPVEQNNEKAFTLYSQAAKAGYSITSENLAYSYECGDIVPPSDEKAFFWYKTSVEQGGSRHAHRELARYYREGMGTEKNLDNAIKCEEAAAKQNDINAMYQLVLDDYPARINKVTNTAEEKKCLEERFLGKIAEFLREIAEITLQETQGDLYLNSDLLFVLPDLFHLHEKVWKLIIANPSFHGEAANKFCQMLEQPRISLQFLHLLSYGEVKEILPLLKNNAPKLFVLQLAGEIIRSDAALPQIFPVLQSSHQLMEFKLNGAKFTEESTRAFTHWAANRRSLVVLDFFNVKFVTPAAAKYFVAALVLFPHLQYLRLASCRLQKDACRELARFVHKNETLQTLDVENDLSGNDSFEPILNALQHNRQIKRLNLSLNDLSQYSQTLLFSSLVNHENIIELKLDGNFSIPEPFKLILYLPKLQVLSIHGGKLNDLARFLKKHKTLTDLEIVPAKHHSKKTCTCSKKLVKALTQPSVILRRYHETVICAKRDELDEKALEKNRSLTEFNLATTFSLNERLMLNRDQASRLLTNWGRASLLIAFARANIKLPVMIMSVVNLFSQVEHFANHSHYKHLSNDLFFRTHFFQSHLSFVTKKKRKLEGTEAPKLSLNRS